MSATERTAARTLPVREARHYGTIVVVGGGCYGAYYVRQLSRAARAGAIGWTRLLVVDRDAGCRVAALSVEERGGDGQRSPAELVRADWREFFAGYLGAAADAPASAAGDAIVPSPLMPHLMYQWVLDRARERWPERALAMPPLAVAPPTPWQRAADGGMHLVSFAEWTCPVNCIEPARCPATRGAREWSMPEAVERWARAEGEAGRPVEAMLLHCTHRAYGVGMFDTADVVAVDARLARMGAKGAVRAVIGTVSHCHGVLNQLQVGPP